MDSPPKARQRTRAELERELRIWRERERDSEERDQAPHDIEGVAGRPAILVYRDKNMAEVKRFVDSLPLLPARYPHATPAQRRTAFNYARRFVRTEAAKMIESLMVVGAHSKAVVRDRLRLKMWVRNRAGKLLRPDVIGEATRSALLGIVEDAYAQNVPYLAGISAETPVEPVEAERRGFG